MGVVPNEQRAIKILAPGQLGLVESCPVREPRPDEILVRVVYVGLNPVDWKSSDLSASIGATLGCDFCGEVVTVGRDVKQKISPGNRVFGYAFGNNPDDLENGAFSEYLAVPGDLVWRLPPHMSFQAGATLGLGLTTVGLGLYHALKLPSPDTPADKPFYVMVYGGGTATGRLAIQMLKQSGLAPIVTCSPHNFKSVQALGAVAAFDYHTDTCGADIRAFTGDAMEFAFDCITDTESMRVCYSAIGSGGGKYIALDPIPVRSHTRRNITPRWIMAFTIFNIAINWQRPFKMDAKPKDREFAEQWYQLVQELLDADTIQPSPRQERDSGLDGIIEGLREIRRGDVSGIKLVYQVQAPQFSV